MAVSYQHDIFGDVLDAIRDALDGAGFSANRVFVGSGDDTDKTVANCVRIVVGPAAAMANLGGGLALMDQSFDVVSQTRMNADDGRRSDERILDAAKGVLRLAHRVQAALDQQRFGSIVAPILLVSSGPVREPPDQQGWITKTDTYNCHWQRTSTP